MPSIRGKELAIVFSTFITGIAAMWSWYSAIPIFIEGDFRSPEQLIIPGFLLVVAAASYALATLFIEQKVLLYTTVVITTVAPFFFINADTATIIALAANAVLVIFATNEIQREKRLSLGFSSYKFLKSGLPVYFTIAAITVSFYFLSYISTENIVDVILPSPALEFILDKVSGPLEPYTGIPQITPDMTINDILRAITLQQLRERGLEEKDVAPSELKNLVNQERMTIEKEYRIALDGDATIPEALQKNISAATNNFLGPYKDYFPLASALIFFLTFKTLTIFAYYLTILLVFIMIKILVYLKVIRRQQITVIVERLMLNILPQDNGQRLLPHPRRPA